MKAETPRVLLVEDDPDDFQLMELALKRTPGEVHLVRVEDGEAAVEYLSGADDYSDRAEHPLPHIMVLDIKLPKRSGFEVLEWIRTQSELRRMPVMMLTSSRHSMDVNRAYDLGASAYFSKPETMKDLAALLGDLKSLWTRWLEFPNLQQEGPTDGRRGKSEPLR
jgi:DNA-binding response OmpR family regulator